MPVQRCTLPIPLLPLWTVRPVQSLSACKRVHFTFTYTSTSPMDRTACTEPQCLYNGALYLYLYLYSPYRPYGLYRASVPVQRCTLPLPILPIILRYLHFIIIFYVLHLIFQYIISINKCNRYLVISSHCQLYIKVLFKLQPEDGFMQAETL